MSSSKTESSTTSCDCVNAPIHPHCDEIKALRHDIDQIDEAIALSLTQRHFLSQKVQALKKAQGQTSYSPDREQEILARIKSLFPSIPAQTVDQIYLSIFDWMRTKD